MHERDREYVDALKEYGEGTANAIWAERVCGTLCNPPSQSKAPERIACVRPCGDECVSV